jgi:hypothetical protein
MSLIWDVRSIEVDDQPEAVIGLNVDTIEITVDGVVTEVNLDFPNATETVQIETPGVQGPPGVKNVYIQTADPAIQYGWGPEQENYIWIPTT